MAREATMPMEDSREHQRVFVRQITRDDLRDALDKGAHDFFQKPTHVVFLVAIYPVVALVLSRLTFGYEVLPILFPLAAGFALLGPVAAIGLYELSRRRELGQQPSWYHAFQVLRSPAIKSIIGLGLILAAVFVLWLAVAWGIFAATLGDVPPSITGFLGAVFTTTEGWTMMIVGNLVGALFALVVLAVLTNITAFQRITVEFQYSATPFTRTFVGGQAEVGAWADADDGSAIAVTNPTYLTPLWEDQLGNMMLGYAAFSVVGILGSSQPSTKPSSTSWSSLRLLMMV